eukprot:1581728-Pleurochrysis_carterae.AAC.3
MEQVVVADDAAFVGDCRAEGTEHGPLSTNDPPAEAAAVTRNATGTASGAAAAPLYPINALRALALSGTRTDLVFLVDVDFVPSSLLLRDLRADTALLSLLELTRTAAVIPAFEVDASSPLPTSQSALAVLCAEGSASPFHVRHFPAGHAPTDFARWFLASEPYEVRERG